jgi:endonuclease/exonuclease/phosphatase family metal-dependent hydrolase
VYPLGLIERGRGYRTWRSAYDRAPVRVLSWNLFHGRAVPPAGRPLLDAFARALAGWNWDVALLQEVPPWWPPALAAAAEAEQRTVLTSRNELLPLRRRIAERWPDLIKSGGGGANAILARDRIREHRAWRLRRWPERRVVHAVRLDGPLHVANLHASQDRRGRPAQDLARAVREVTEWCGDGPLVLGGDLNQRGTIAPPGFVHATGHSVDHLLSRGLVPAGPGRTLERGGLSDHAPLLVELREGRES